MSLVTIWTTEKFAAVCCDGRLSRRGKDGSLIPVREDFTKFRAVTETIVLASTGSQFIFDALTRCVDALTVEHKNSRELFNYLEVAVPLQARDLLRLGADRFDEPLEVYLALVGFDEAQGRIRCLSWASDDDLLAVEHGPGTGCFGNDEAVPIARAMLKRLSEAQSDPRLDDVLPTMEQIIVSVAKQVPHSVNKNVKAHIVVTPGKASDLIMDGTRAAWGSVAQKNAAVDSSGNLLLKNVNDAVGSTTGPSTTSTTYAVIPEMTQTLTFQGNKVLLIFTAALNLQSNTNDLGFDIAIFKDGVQLSQSYSGTGGQIDDLASGVFYPVRDYEIPFAVSFIDQPSAGSHTYDVRWRIHSGGTGTLFQLGTGRRFQIVELG